MDSLPIKNKVAESGILTLDLEQWVPVPQVKALDMAELLEQGLLLRESSFKEKLAQVDWKSYEGSEVAIYCSTDAIVPQWSWMWMVRDAQAAGISAHMAHPKELYTRLFLEALSTKVAQEDAQLQKARVVVKGCGSGKVPTEAYAALVNLLAPKVKSLMYGEPCSTVPVLKNKA